MAPAKIRPQVSVWFFGSRPYMRAHVSVCVYGSTIVCVCVCVCVCVHLTAGAYVFLLVCL